VSKVFGAALKICYPIGAKEWNSPAFKSSRANEKAFGAAQLRTYYF
jgi:hypothetical protein